MRMPIQAPQWTDYLNCPVCCREFGAPPRSPISLSCGHTICKHCLAHLHRRQCPFDQSVIQLDPEEFVVNTALLQLAGFTPPAQPYHPPCIESLPESDRNAYDVIVHCMEELATYLKYCGNGSTNSTGSRLSRPMQRKLVTLVQCAFTDSEGRGRTARAARSLGERTVTELILQHQNPQQLSANLWAAVRARGCQFLGPAMQEEVLKLVLLALEDGSALSRKVLVLFIVQRLEPHFPQASKTSIGHVVQLLYRASCFKVSKRECDSSLMQLKEEFRTYESLRREHDAQIVQIATEAGLRIAPDQWSALLYGDAVHKSQMQSIIDKLQTPQSFAQSIQELFIALQRTDDPAHLSSLNVHLDKLASIDASPDAKSPSWHHLSEVLSSLREVVSGLIQYLQQQLVRDANHNKHLMMDRPIDPATGLPYNNSVALPMSGKYKVVISWDPDPPCFPSANPCNYVPTEQELERYRNSQGGSPNLNGNYPFLGMPPPMPMGPHLPSPQLATTSGMSSQQPMYPSPYGMMQMPPPPPPPPSTQQQQASASAALPPGSNMVHRRGNPMSADIPDMMQPPSYPHRMINGQLPSGMENKNGLRGMGDRPRFDHPPFQQTDVSYFSELPPYYKNTAQNYQLPLTYHGNQSGPSGSAGCAAQGMVDMNNLAAHGQFTPQGQMQLNAPMGQDRTFVPVQTEAQSSRDLSPYPFDNVTNDLLADSFRALNARRASPWAAQEDAPVFSFEAMRSSMPESVPHSTSLGAPLSAPLSVPFSMPHSATLNAQLSVPFSMSPSAQHSATLTAPPSIPHNMPLRMPMNAPYSMPLNAPHSMPLSAPHSMPLSAPHSMPLSAPHSMPLSAPPLNVPRSATPFPKLECQDEMELEHEIQALERRLDLELDK